MVLDVGEGNVVCACEVWEVWCVWGKFARFGEVDECAHACCEEFVEFLCGCLERGPRVFAGEELGRRPVRVGDGTWTFCEDGWEGRATLRFTAVDGDGRDVGHVECFDCGGRGEGRRRVFI